MTPHANPRFTLQAPPRAEHETLAHASERSGERPGETAGSLRQHLLSDVGHSSGPSRYLPPLHVVRHAWAPATRAARAAARRRLAPASRSTTSRRAT